MLQPRQLVNDKYRIVRLIGEGGMGSVYEAEHVVLGHHVALKFLHPEIARQPNLQQRFLQEARLSATIDNPHIVRVTDVDTTSEGAYLVMELLQGEPLQTLLDREQRLPKERAVGFTLQILQGLAAAHALGVVHRDLKPDNVFVTPSPYGQLLKLLDFGIAKLRATQEYQMTLTRPGAIMGTPEYMAPEQAYSADLVDERSDLYSVGIMLFEMLSATLPAEGDSPQKIAEMAIKGQVRNLADLCPELPVDLVRVVSRAIEPVPERRWANAQQMQQALLPWATPDTGSKAPEPFRMSALPVAPSFEGRRHTPVVPREQLQRSAAPGQAAYSSARETAVTQPEMRRSNVPLTLHDDQGPPAEAKVTTASMPQVAAGALGAASTFSAGSHLSAVPMAAMGTTGIRPPTTAAKRRRSGLPWGLVLLPCLAAAGALGWYYQDYWFDVPEPPPQPTRKAPQTAAAPPQALESDLAGDDLEAELGFEDDFASRSPLPRSGGAPPPVAGGPAPGPGIPALPTFQLPTNLPALPTTLPPLPSTLPTAFPGLPFPFPGGSAPLQPAPPGTE